MLELIVDVVKAADRFQHVDKIPEGESLCGEQGVGEEGFAEEEHREDKENVEEVE